MLDKTTLMIPILLLGGFFAVYWFLDPETAELNDAVRSRLGGSYVRLSQGMTHYSLEGSENGRTIVLVHGATIPMFCWDELSPMLAKAGFQVLRYDMYGRGYSDRPNVTYDRELYINQLRELLDVLMIRGPVDLVGVSMGAGTICDFSARFPERVDRLGFISPLVNEIHAPFILRVPVLGEVGMRFAGSRRIRKRAESLADVHSVLFKRQIRLFNEQIEYRGFQRSFLSMMRNAASADYRDSYGAVGRQNRRVFLVWGTQDTDVTKDKIDLARELIPNLEFHAIANGKHGILSLNFDQVQRLLVSFFRQGR